MKNILLLFTFFLCMAPSAYGSETAQSDRPVMRHRLSTGQMIVVAEGDLEPRSIGSYSIRIYRADPEFPMDDFISGIIRPRDGSLEKVVTHDIDRDGSEEIVVVFRSAGTGGYLSADAFRFKAGQLTLAGSVTELAKDADPVDALTSIF